jgi:hypothetical protein
MLIEYDVALISLQKYTRMLLWWIIKGQVLSFPALASGLFLIFMLTFVFYT